MITLIILSPLALFICGALAAVAREAGKGERQTEAASIYRAHTVRNGVSAPIPFAEHTAKINLPGMIEVLPLRERTPAHPGAPDHLRTEAGTPGTAFRAAHPYHRPLEDRVSSETMAETMAETMTETIAADEPKPAATKYGYGRGAHSAYEISEQAVLALHQLIDSGEGRKTALAWAIFGATGGNAYTSCKQVIDEALKNAG